MTTNLKITRIERPRELYKYQDIWSELIESYKFYGPWLSFDWFQLWLKHFGDETELVFLIVHDKDRVLAIAPFCLRSERNKTGFRTRKLELIGNEMSPIRNLIIKDLSEQEIGKVISSVVKYFVNEFRGWDVMELDTLPQDREIFHLLKKSIQDNALRSRDYTSASNWYLNDINYSFDKYFANLPKKLRKDIEYCKRRMARDGDLHFIIIANPHQVEEYMGYYYAVREKSWKAPEKGREFIMEFTHKCAENGWLRLGFLFFNGAPIAAQKWVIFGNTAFIWDILHDETFNKYSPGKVLTTHVLEGLMGESRIEEIDFMTGDDPYKKDWTPQRRDRKGITAFNKTMKGRTAAFVMTKLMPTVKRSPRLAKMTEAVSCHLRGR